MKQKTGKIIIIIYFSLSLRQNYAFFSIRNKYINKL